MILLPVVLLLALKISTIDKEDLYVVSIAVTGIFLFIHITASLGHDIQYKRGEQISYNQGVPFLEKRYPDWNRFAYLATKVNDYITHDKSKNTALKYSIMAQRDRPNDDIGYLYLAKSYMMLDKLKCAEIVLVEGMMKTSHEKNLRKSLENLYKIKQMGTCQYAYPYFRPQPLTINNSLGQTFSMENAKPIIAAFAGVKPDTSIKIIGFSYKFKRNGIRYDIRLMPDKFDIYAPIIIMPTGQSPDVRESSLRVLSKAWEEVRLGNTEPFKFFLEPTALNGQGIYIGASLRYTNINPEIMMEIVQKGEEYAIKYQKLLLETGQAQYEYLD